MPASKIAKEMGKRGIKDPAFALKGENGGREKGKEGGRR